MAVFEDFQQVAALWGGQDGKALIIDDQHLHAGDGFEGALKAAPISKSGAAGQSEGFEHAWSALIEDRPPIPACLVTQGVPSDPAFAEDQSVRSFSAMQASPVRQWISRFSWRAIQPLSARRAMTLRSRPRGVRRSRSQRLGCPSLAPATGQWPVYQAPGHVSIAISPVFGASTISRLAWWLLAVHQPKPMPFDCRSNLPAMPWNECPRSRGIRARHRVESMPAITWNTHCGARTCRSSAAPFTSIATCWPMPPNICTSSWARIIVS